MTPRLGLVIGDGEVGRYVAGRIRSTNPSAAVIGLSTTREWLPKVVPDAPFVAPLRWGDMLARLEAHNVTDVCLVGESFGSFRSVPDITVLRATVRARNAWVPWGFYDVALEILTSKGITTRCILQYFPEMAAGRELKADNCPGYDPRPDFDAVRREIKQLPPRRLYQAAIVDGGRILARESNRQKTNKLIENFGHSGMAASATFPVLCKASIPKYQAINPPVIGIETVKLCCDNGIRAIVVEAGNTILMQRDEVIELLNDRQVGLYAVD